MIIKNGTLHDGYGQVIHADLRIEGGRIAEIGPDLSGEAVFDASGCQVYPGFIDPFTNWGINGSSTEVKESSEDHEELSGPLQPELEVTYAVSGRAIAAQQLPAYGITACCVVPSAVNLFGGQASVFYTDGRINALKSLARRNAAMVLSVSSMVQAVYGSKGICPMTKMAVFGLLKDTLARARYEEELARDEKLSAVAHALNHRQTFFVHCDNAQDRERVTEIFAGYSAPLVFLSHDNLRKGEGCLTQRDAALVCGYDGINFHGQRERIDPELLCSYAKKGTRLMASGTGSKSFGRENYMWSAIALMKSIKDEEKVVSMMTSTPAKILGIHGQTGSLTPGKRADLSIWSDSPLKTFEARVFRTIIGGETVYREGDERRCYY